MDDFVFKSYSKQSSNRFLFLDKDIVNHNLLLAEFEIPQKSEYGDIIYHTAELQSMTLLDFLEQVKKDEMYLPSILINIVLLKIIGGIHERIHKLGKRK